MSSTFGSCGADGGPAEVDGPVCTPPDAPAEVPSIIKFCHFYCYLSVKIGTYMTI